MGAGLGVRSLSDSRQALQLGFSFAGVNTHVARMYKKLGATKRAEAVKPAESAGLLAARDHGRRVDV